MKAGKLTENTTFSKWHLVPPVFSLLLIMSGGSCSPGHDITEKPETSVRTESAVQLPSYLQAMEKEAEEIIALAGGEKWEAVGAKVETISTTWQDYLPQAPVRAASEKIEEVQEQIETLKSHAELKERMKTMQSANSLHGLLVDLYELQHPAVPAVLERLHIAERQVLLDTESGKPQMAQIKIDKSRDYWNKLKAAVIYHGGEQLSERFQASLDLQEDYLKAGKQDLLSAEVENGLEVLDMIEDLF